MNRNTGSNATFASIINNIIPHLAKLDPSTSTKRQHFNPLQPAVEALTTRVLWPQLLTTLLDSITDGSFESIPVGDIAALVQVLRSFITDTHPMLANTANRIHSPLIGSNGDPNHLVSCSHWLTAIQIVLTIFLATTTHQTGPFISRTSTIAPFHPFSQGFTTTTTTTIKSSETQSAKQPHKKAQNNQLIDPFHQPGSDGTDVNIIDYFRFNFMQSQIAEDQTQNNAAFLTTMAQSGTIQYPGTLLTSQIAHKYKNSAKLPHPPLANPQLSIIVVLLSVMDDFIWFFDHIILPVENLQLFEQTIASQPDFQVLIGSLGLNQNTHQQQDMSASERYRQFTSHWSHPVTTLKPQICHIYHHITLLTATLSTLPGHLLQSGPSTPQRAGDNNEEAQSPKIPPILESVITKSIACAQKCLLHGVQWAQNLVIDNITTIFGRYQWFRREILSTLAKLTAETIQTQTLAIPQQTLASVATFSIKQPSINLSLFIALQCLQSTTSTTTQPSYYHTPLIIPHQQQPNQRNWLNNDQTLSSPPDPPTTTSVALGYNQLPTRDDMNELFQFYSQLSQQPHSVFGGDQAASSNNLKSDNYNLLTFLFPLLTSPLHLNDHISINNTTSQILSYTSLEFILDFLDHITSFTIDSLQDATAAKAENLSTKIQSFGTQLCNATLATHLPIAHIMIQSAVTFIIRYMAPLIESNDGNKDNQQQRQPSHLIMLEIMTKGKGSCFDLLLPIISFYMGMDPSDFTSSLDASCDEHQQQQQQQQHRTNVVSCICQNVPPTTSPRSSQLWIDCDHCHTWSHGACLSVYTPEEVYNLGMFQCLSCNRLTSAGTALSSVGLGLLQTFMVHSYPAIISNLNRDSLFHSQSLPPTTTSLTTNATPIPPTNSAATNPKAAYGSNSNLSEMKDSSQKFLTNSNDTQDHLYIGQENHNTNQQEGHPTNPKLTPAPRGSRRRPLLPQSTPDRAASVVEPGKSETSRFNTAAGNNSFTEHQSVKSPTTTTTTRRMSSRTRPSAPFPPPASLPPFTQEPTINNSKPFQTFTQSQILKHFPSWLTLPTHVQATFPQYPPFTTANSASLFPKVAALQLSVLSHHILSYFRAFSQQQSSIVQTAHFSIPHSLRQPPLLPGKNCLEPGPTSQSQSTPFTDLNLQFDSCMFLIGQYNSQLFLRLSQLIRSLLIFREYTKQLELVATTASFSQQSPALLTQCANVAASTVLPSHISHYVRALLGQFATQTDTILQSFVVTPLHLHERLENNDGTNPSFKKNCNLDYFSNEHGLDALIQALGGDDIVQSGHMTQPNKQSNSNIGHEHNDGDDFLQHLPPIRCLRRLQLLTQCRNQSQPFSGQKLSDNVPPIPLRMFVTDDSLGHHDTQLNIRDKKAKDWSQQQQQHCQNDDQTSQATFLHVLSQILSTTFEPLGDARFLAEKPVLVLLDELSRIMLEFVLLVDATTKLQQAHPLYLQLLAPRDHLILQMKQLVPILSYHSGVEVSVGNLKQGSSYQSQTRARNANHFYSTSPLLRVSFQVQSDHLNFFVSIHTREHDHMIAQPREEQIALGQDGEEIEDPATPSKNASFSFIVQLYNASLHRQQQQLYYITHHHNESSTVFSSLLKRAQTLLWGQRHKLAIPQQLLTTILLKTIKSLHIFTLLNPTLFSTAAFMSFLGRIFGTSSDSRGDNTGFMITPTDSNHSTLPATTTQLETLLHTLYNIISLASQPVHRYQLVPSHLQSKGLLDKYSPPTMIETCVQDYPNSSLLDGFQHHIDLFSNDTFPLNHNRNPPPLIAPSPGLLLSPHLPYIPLSVVQNPSAIFMATPMEQRQPAVSSNLVKSAALTLFPSGYVFFAPYVFQSYYMRLLIPLLWDASAAIRKKALQVILTDILSFLAGDHPNDTSHDNLNNEPNSNFGTTTRLTVAELYQHHGYDLPSHQLSTNDDTSLQVSHFSPEVQLEINNTFDEALENFRPSQLGSPKDQNNHRGNSFGYNSNNNSLNSDSLPITHPLNCHQKSNIEIVFDSFVLPLFASSTALSKSLSPVVGQHSQQQPYLEPSLLYTMFHQLNIILHHHHHNNEGGLSEPMSSPFLSDIGQNSILGGLLAFFYKMFTQHIDCSVKPVQSTHLPHFLLLDPDQHRADCKNMGNDGNAGDGSDLDLNQIITFPPSLDCPQFTHPESQTTVILPASSTTHIYPDQQSNWFSFSIIGEPFSASSIDQPQPQLQPKLLTIAQPISLFVHSAISRALTLFLLRYVQFLSTLPSTNLQHSVLQLVGYSFGPFDQATTLTPGTTASPFTKAFSGQVELVKSLLSKLLPVSSQDTASPTATTMGDDSHIGPSINDDCNKQRPSLTQAQKTQLLNVNTFLAQCVDNIFALYLTHNWERPCQYQHCSPIGFTLPTAQPAQNTRSISANSALPQGMIFPSHNESPCWSDLPCLGSQMPSKESFITLLLIIIQIQPQIFIQNQLRLNSMLTLFNSTRKSFQRIISEYHQLSEQISHLKSTHRQLTLRSDQLQQHLKSITATNDGGGSSVVESDDDDSQTQDFLGTHQHRQSKAVQEQLNECQLQLNENEQQVHILATRMTHVKTTTLPTINNEFILSIRCLDVLIPQLPTTDLFNRAQRSSLHSFTAFPISSQHFFKHSILSTLYYFLPPTTLHLPSTTPSPPKPYHPAHEWSFVPPLPGTETPSPLLFHPFVTPTPQFTSHVPGKQVIDDNIHQLLTAHQRKLQQQQKWKDPLVATARAHLLQLRSTFIVTHVSNCSRCHSNNQTRLTSTVHPPPLVSTLGYQYLILSATRNIEEWKQLIEQKQPCCLDCGNYLSYYYNSISVAYFTILTWISVSLHQPMAFNALCTAANNPKNVGVDNSVHQNSPDLIPIYQPHHHLKTIYNPETRISTINHNALSISPSDVLYSIEVLAWAMQSDPQLFVSVFNNPFYKFPLLPSPAAALPFLFGKAQAPVDRNNNQKFLFSTLASQTHLSHATLPIFDLLAITYTALSSQLVGVMPYSQGPPPPNAPVPLPPPLPPTNIEDAEQLQQYQLQQQQRQQHNFIQQSIHQYSCKQYDYTRNLLPVLLFGLGAVSTVNPDTLIQPKPNTLPTQPHFNYYSKAVQNHLDLLQKQLQIQHQEHNKTQQTLDTMQQILSTRSILDMLTSFASAPLSHPLLSIIVASANTQQSLQPTNVLPHHQLQQIASQQQQACQLIQTSPVYLSTALLSSLLENLLFHRQNANKNKVRDGQPSDTMSLRSNHLTQSRHSDVSTSLQRCAKEIIPNLLSTIGPIRKASLCLVLSMFNYGAINSLDIATSIYTLSMDPQPLIAYTAIKFLQPLTAAAKLSIGTSPGLFESHLSNALTHLHFLTHLSSQSFSFISRSVQQEQLVVSNTTVSPHNTLLQLMKSIGSFTQPFGHIPPEFRRQILLQACNSILINPSQLYISNGYKRLSANQHFSNMIATSLTSAAVNNSNTSNSPIFAIVPASIDIVLGKTDSILKLSQGLEISRQILSGVGQIYQKYHLHGPNDQSSKQPKQSRLQRLDGDGGEEESEKDLRKNKNGKTQKTTGEDHHSTDIPGPRPIAFIGSLLDHGDIINVIPINAFDWCEEALLHMFNQTTMTRFLLNPQLQQSNTSQPSNTSMTNPETLLPYPFLQLVTGQTHPCSPLIYAYFSHQNSMTSQQYTRQSNNTEPFAIYASPTIPSLSFTLNSLTLKGEHRAQFIRQLVYNALDLRPWHEAMSMVFVYLSSSYTPLSNQNLFEFEHRVSNLQPKSQLMRTLGALHTVHNLVSLSLTVPMCAVQNTDHYQTAKTTSPYITQLQSAQSYLNSLLHHDGGDEHQLPRPSIQQIETWIRADNLEETKFTNLMGTITSSHSNLIIRGDFAQLPISSLFRSNFLHRCGQSTEPTQSLTTLPTKSALDCLQSLTYIISLINSIPSLQHADAVVIIQELKALLTSKTRPILDQLPFVLAALGFHSLQLASPSLQLPPNQASDIDASEQSVQQLLRQTVTDLHRQNYSISDPIDLQMLSAVFAADERFLRSDEENSHDQTVLGQFVKSRAKTGPTISTLAETRHEFYTKLYQHVLTSLQLPRSSSNSINSPSTPTSISPTNSPLTLQAFINLCSIPQPVLLSYLSIMSQYATALSALGMFYFTLQFNFKMSRTDLSEDPNAMQGTIDQNLEVNDSEDDGYYELNDLETTSKAGTKNVKSSTPARDGRQYALPVSFGHLPLLSYYTDTIGSSSRLSKSLSASELLTPQLRQDVARLQPILTQLISPPTKFGPQITSLSSSIYPPQSLLAMWSYHYALLSQSPQLHLLEYELFTASMSQSEQVNVAIQHMCHFYPTWHRLTVSSLYNYFAKHLALDSIIMWPSSSIPNDVHQENSLDQKMLAIRATICTLSMVFHPAQVETFTASFRFLSQLHSFVLDEYASYDQVQQAFSTRQNKKIGVSKRKLTQAKEPKASRAKLNNFKQSSDHNNRKKHKDDGGE